MTNRGERLYLAAMGCFFLAMFMFTAAGESRGGGLGGVCGVLAFPTVITGIVLVVKAVREFDVRRESARNYQAEGANMAEDDLFIPEKNCIVFSTPEDRDPNTCGRCGRPGGARREHPCLNDDGSSVYFREKYGPPRSKRVKEET